VQIQTKAVHTSRFKCTVCGKRVEHWGTDWGYMFGNEKLCSYTCMRKRDPHNKKLYNLSAIIGSDSDLFMRPAEKTNVFPANMADISDFDR